VRVELTIAIARMAIAGFEDRDDHRTACASVFIINDLQDGAFVPLNNDGTLSMCSVKRFPSIGEAHDLGREKDHSMNGAA